MNDIRDSLFSTIENRKFRAALSVDSDGILAGLSEAAVRALELGISWDCAYKDGDSVKAGTRFAYIVAGPKQIALAEEILIGTVSKASGIATAAAKAKALAGGKIKVVSGAWKKMPPEIKDLARKAVKTGGAGLRVCEPPMIYIDKNYVEMFGSVEKALKAASGLPQETKRIIQLKAKNAAIEEETRQALSGGAHILMVDTGNHEDLEKCISELNRLGKRSEVQICFAGNVKIDDIPWMIEKGVDIVGIGKEIIDAGLLDMKFDVLEEI